MALAEADALFAHLHAHAPLVPEAPVVFGKVRPVKRESCAFGDPGVRYRYSGLVREALPWPELMLPLVERLRAHTATPFNFVLCNRYPDGDAALGWHADDEVDLMRGASIASISLGATRDFAVRHRDGGTALFTVALAHGSLVVMGGATQEHYRHRVPVRRRCATPRINLTFRLLR
jgi:alkylated DNA repair dioxygenase AlkB